MVNCIGALPDRDAVLAVPGAHLHDYGNASRRGRKVGHVTIGAADASALEPGLERVVALVRASADG
jgi:5-(carboxyamino)imidazole ribonucleotide synthase